MKIYTIILILFFYPSLINAENYIMWGNTQGIAMQSGVTNSGTSFTCGGMGPYDISTDIWSVNLSTGLTTNLASWDIRQDQCGIKTDAGVTFENGSWFDSSTGYMYGVQNDSSIKIFDAFNNGSLIGSFAASTWNQPGHSVVADGRQQVGVPKIVDASGNRIIEAKSDGSIHIGENSLVTHETGGRQQLYATDVTGNRIDLNIPPGTNLLIDGENVMGKIDSSVALGAAFASLPTGAEGAGYTCGLGTGFHDSASAISGGCGFDFANYTFVDSMPKMFQKASFNVGAATVVRGEGDDATLKAGITFKFGEPKPVRESRDHNILLENKINAVMQENRTLKAQLKEDNDLIRQENDLLKAQIAEINTQLKALSMLAMN